MLSQKVGSDCEPPESAFTSEQVSRARLFAKKEEQRFRRVSKIVFHFKDVDEFKTVSVDGKDYKNKLQLMQLASD